MLCHATLIMHTALDYLYVAFIGHNIKPTCLVSNPHAPTAAFTCPDMHSARPLKDLL